MSRGLATFILIGLAGCALIPAAESVRLRIACVNAADVPTLIVPLDVERTSSAWPTLSPTDFRLLEDGSKTTAADRVRSFRDSGMGLALIVALDASGSMNGRPIAAIQKGLAQLVSRKRAQDRVAVLSFADDARWETKWDSSEQATQEAFRNLKTRGNLTRLYDAVDQSIAEFKDQADKGDGFPRRRCLLIISDGHDEGSQIKLLALLHRLSESGIRLDAVGLAHSRAWLTVLRQIASTGYGEFLSAATPEDLSDRLGQGIDSLLDMPTLNFKAQHIEADGKTHQIGIAYGPTGFREQLTLTLPLAFWRSPRNIYIAAALVALILGISLFAFLKPKREPRSQAVAEAATPVPSAPPAPAPKRAPTVAEPSIPMQSQGQAMASAATVRADPLTAMQMTSPMQFAAPPPAARMPTLLAPDTAGSLQLKVLAGPYTDQKFDVTEEEFWIGSAPNNHLCLSADPGISANHMCIRREQTFYRLYDNGSRNNTYVNGRPVSQEVTLLRTGDRIRLGATDFLVEAAQ